MGEILAKSHTKLRCDLALSQAIKSKVEQGVALTSAAQIKELVRNKLDQDISVDQIRRVMREDLNMRYLKIIRTAPHANSDKSLVLR